MRPNRYAHAALAGCFECPRVAITLVNIIYNGEAKIVADHISIAELLEELKLVPRQVAVEVNLQLVPRGEHRDLILHDGDRLEVVTLVGGG